MLAWSNWEPSAETLRQLREMDASAQRGAVPNFWTDRRYIPADLEDQAELIGELRQATMEAIRSEAKAQDELAKAQDELAKAQEELAALKAAELPTAPEAGSTVGALTTVLVVFTIALLLNLAWAISQLGGGR